MMNRRTVAKASLAGMVSNTLAACGNASAALHWYRLPSEPPAGEAAPRAAAAGAATVGATWELASALPMPELLERDTLQFEDGAAGIRLLHGHRWAEPLRDTLPRLLRHDLALFVPGLWTGPAAPGVPVAGRVQVELLALQGSLQRRQVALAARWVVTAGTQEPPRTYRTDEAVPWTDAATESLVLAQRVAMWRLARRIAASLPMT